MIVLVMVVYMFGYASGSVVAEGTSAVAVTHGKVSGTVFMMFIIVTIIDVVTCASTTEATFGNDL